jgi:hypothetical protein
VDGSAWLCLDSAIVAHLGCRLLQAAQERIPIFPATFALRKRQAHGGNRSRFQVKINDSSTAFSGISRRTYTRTALETASGAASTSTTLRRMGGARPYGKPEHRERQARGIGAADTTVTRGRHTYLIVYKTARRSDFFPNMTSSIGNVTRQWLAVCIDRAWRCSYPRRRRSCTNGVLHGSARSAALKCGGTGRGDTVPVHHWRISSMSARVDGCGGIFQRCGCAPTDVEKNRE